MLLQIRRLVWSRCDRVPARLLQIAREQREQRRVADRRRQSEPRDRAAHPAVVGVSGGCFAERCERCCGLEIRFLIFIFLRDAIACGADAQAEADAECALESQGVKQFKQWQLANGS